MAAHGSIHERAWCASAVASLRDGPYDPGMVTRRGVFHAADVTPCQTRRTRDLGTLAIDPPRVVAGDIDGDGRDNVLVGLASGELLALDERDGDGVILWRDVLDAAIRDTRFADLDADGRADMLVETNDGRMRIFGSCLPTRQKDRTLGRGRGAVSIVPGRRSLCRPAAHVTLLRRRAPAAVPRSAISPTRVSSTGQ